LMKQKTSTVRTVAVAPQQFSRTRLASSNGILGQVGSKEFRLLKSTDADNLIHAVSGPYEGLGSQDQPLVYRNDQALEYVLKHLSGPQVLTIYTHGEYVPPEEVALPDPLLRSRLAMAGANVAGRSTAAPALD